MLPDDTGELFLTKEKVERFSEIDLWNLEPYDVDSLSFKDTALLYKDVVFKLSNKDFLRIRTKDYWIIKDRQVNKYDKMKLLIYCYLMDRDKLEIDWDYIKSITVDEREKPSALKPSQDEL